MNIQIHNQYDNCIAMCYSCDRILKEFLRQQNICSVSARLESEGPLVRFPAEINIFILFFFPLVFRSSQLGGALANEIKHENSPVVFIV